MIKTMEVSPECCTTSNVVTISEYLFLRLNDTNAELKADNARLRSALRRAVEFIRAEGNATAHGEADVLESVLNESQ